MKKSEKREKLEVLREAELVLAYEKKSIAKKVQFVTADMFITGVGLD